LVEIRVRVKNGLQHLALNRGLQKKSKLWTEAGQKALRELPLESWAACRREDLLGLLASLDKSIDKLDAAVKRAADEHPQARLLMTQPGVGPITSLAFVLTLGDVSRFRRGKQVASYLGLIPRERSSGGKQRLGAINKQGNSLLRTLLVESAQTVTRLDEGFRKQYLHRCHRMPKGIAKVAAARGTTLLDVAHQRGISGDRSHREQPDTSRGRRKLDRETDWALSHPDWPGAKDGAKYAPWKTVELFSTFTPARRLDVRIEESWSQFGPHRWLVERFAP
jgi:hypothetical protein